MGREGLEVGGGKNRLPFPLVSCGQCFLMQQDTLAWVIKLAISTKGERRMHFPSIPWLSLFCFCAFPCPSSPTSPLSSAETSLSHLHTHKGLKAISTRERRSLDPHLWEMLYRPHILLMGRWMVESTRDSLNPTSDRLKTKTGLLNNSHGVFFCYNNSILLVRFQMYLWSNKRRTNNKQESSRLSPGSRQLNKLVVHFMVGLTHGNEKF